MQTLDVIQELAEYYGKEMTPGIIKVYITTLEDLPPDLVDMAAKELIKNGKPFMPKVSEIRKVAAELRRSSRYELVDPLKLIPGAAQTEADLDERYGTRQEWKEIGDILASGGTLSDGQRTLLALGTRG